MCQALCQVLRTQWRLMEAMTPLESLRVSKSRISALKAELASPSEEQGQASQAEGIA